MQRLALSIALVGLFTVTNRAATCGQTAPGNDMPLVVHVYNYAQERLSVLLAAGTEAERIFDSAGVVSRWRTCQPRKSADVPDEPGCEAPSADHEFSLRIMQDV
jgi:hypothetical protein